MFDDFFYKWYPSRYRADTRHLTPEQDGIYRRLIDEYMETRQPLPDNPCALARIAGCSIDAWAIAEPLIRPYFFSKNGLLCHAFCNKMLDEQDAYAKKHSDRGKRGAEKRWRNAIEKQGEKCYSYGKSNASSIAKEKDKEEEDKKEKKTKAKKEPVLKTRLPYELMPPEWQDWCFKEMGWNPEQSHSAWPGFFDYWNSPNAKDPLKADWFTTFKNSCRNGITKPTNKGGFNATDKRDPATRARDIGEQIIAKRNAAKAERMRGFTEPANNPALPNLCLPENIRRESGDDGV